MNPYIMVIGVYTIPIILFIVWKCYNIWQYTQPNHIMAHVIDDKDEVRVFWCHTFTEDKTERFNLESGDYQVIPDCTYKEGRWRIPTAYYNKGHSEPINIKTLKTGSKISSKELEAAREQHVARDILEEIDKPFFNVSTLIWIVIIALVIGFFYTSYRSDKNFEKILNPPITQTTPTPSNPFPYPTPTPR